MNPEAKPPADSSQRVATAVLPWVLLVTAVVVALSVSAGPSPVASASSAVTAAPAASAAPGGGDPPLDEMELRESRIHVGHEQCEEGAKRINVLEGKPPTDPSALHFIGSCLRHGNMAWYKCILKAGTREQAGTCNRRLLSGANVP